MYLRTACVVALSIVALHHTELFGFGAQNENGANNGATRWDAAARTIAGGIERSLDGGLRYSFGGGSVANYINSFTWANGEQPANPAAYMQGLFDVWRTPDPALGGLFATQLSFVDDTANTTATAGSTTTGAEIDLIASNIGTGFQGFAQQGFSNTGTGVTLTTGVPSASNWFINGSDVTMNNNPAVAWTQNLFGNVFVHEIGHSLGLDDVDVSSGPSGRFIDDNYDDTNTTTIVATLTNTFSDKIDPLNPEGSPGLNAYTIAAATFDDGPSSAPNLFMESNGDGISGPPALDNDTFAGRQYLYPVQVPEPSSFLFLGLALLFAQISRRNALS